MILLGGMKMFLFWIVIIGLLIYLGKDRIFGNTNQKTKQNALEILKMRYAKGEIDEQTYQRMKNEL